MSRASRRRAARARAAAQSSQAPAAFSPNGFAGAEPWSRERGYVYFPELDTRREVDSYTRTELLRKARFLYANVGFVRRIVNGISRMVVGVGLSPQATTKDRDWNKLAQDSFENRAVARHIWDINGKYNFYQMQRAIKRSAFKDGDCGVVLTESEAGKAARYALYESHQIGGSDRGFVDGVRTVKPNRAVAYQLLGRDNVKVSISADDFVFFADFERPGQNRGLTILYHAINNLLDTTEILSFMKTGVKSSMGLGYVIEQSGGDNGPPSPIPRNVRDKLQTPAGKKIELEKLFGGGKIEELDPGQVMKVLHDSRPHPNTLGGLDYLARDISWGCGLSPEVLWAVEKLGGANMRFILQDAQVFIEEQQQELIDIFCTRCWIYHVAKEMAAGRLRRCQDPEWWKHTWTPPARMTVDIGKDGRLYMEQIKGGALSFSRFHAWQGLDSTEELNKWLDEMRDIREGAIARGLDPDMVIDRIYGRSGVAVSKAGEEEDDDPKKKKAGDDAGEDEDDE